jgi:hypothetical protein
MSLLLEILPRPGSPHPPHVTPQLTTLLNHHLLVLFEFHDDQKQEDECEEDHDC